MVLNLNQLQCVLKVDLNIISLNLIILTATAHIITFQHKLTCKGQIGCVHHEFWAE